MRVFISWSGERSRAIGEVLRQWLPLVIHAVDPYFSPDEIIKGSIWESQIASALEDISVGILCLTPDSLQAPWVMFEAGALSKRLEESRVCPLLFGVEPKDVSGPLLEFKPTEFSKDEMRRIVEMINEQVKELSSNNLRATFEKWWPSLESDVERILTIPQPEPQTRRSSERELLEQILELIPLRRNV